MRLVVTGAAGFLGSEVVHQAGRAGWEVVPVSRRARAASEGHQLVDIADLDRLHAVMQDADAVIHCAGLAHVFAAGAGDGDRFLAANTIGARNVASAAANAGVKDLVLISSVAVYGPHPPRGCTEDVTCEPVGDYALTKLRGEQEATRTLQGTSTRLTVLRMATIYGEHDPGNVRRLIGAIDRGRFLWIGDGCNMKSLIYRADAARACLSALGRPGSSPAVFNVSAPPCRMAEVVEAIAMALGRRVPRFRIPAGLAVLASSSLRLAGGPFARLHRTLDKWLADDAFDSNRLRVAAGFRPETPLREGIRREVAWYRSTISADV